MSLVIVVGMLAVTSHAQPVLIDRHAATVRTPAGPREVERGILRTFAQRAASSGPLIEIPWLRLRATTDKPGPPLFLLAGGPGGTYLDDLRDEAEFGRWLDALLKIGDVVLLEQRGSNTTDHALMCHVKLDLPLDQAWTPDDYRGDLIKAIQQGRDRHAEGAVPLSAFTIEEMARDYHDLRRLLGYEQFNLIGGSFGSQLGLKIIGIDPASTHRAVFYGVEGPGHTLDRTDLAEAHLRRVSEAMDHHWQARLLIGNFGAAIRRIAARLEREPLRGVVETDAGEQRVVEVGPFDFKRMLWSTEGIQGYRDKIARAGRLVMAMRLGRDRDLLNAKLRLHERLVEGQGLELNLAPLLIDATSYTRSSGPPGSTPGHAPPMVEDAFFGPDVVYVDQRLIFRALTDNAGEAGAGDNLAEATAPILLVAGGLDGFTPPEYARQVAASLPQSRLLYAPLGDHDGWSILASDPALFDRTIEFLAGRTAVDSFPAEVSMAPLRVRLVPTWVIALTAAGAGLLVGLAVFVIRRYRRRKRASRGDPIDITKAYRKCV